MYICVFLRCLTLLGFIVYGSSRITKSSFKALNFAKAIEGRKLNGSLIKQLAVDTEIDCQFECVEEGRCLSYNFGPAFDGKGFQCQLSNSDRFVGLKNFTEDEDLIYRGLQSACESDHSICGDKGVCIPNYDDDSTTCNCTRGYTGKPCEAKSCAQLLQDGATTNGVYTINPDGGKPMQVLCDMTTDGGGWTVFQTRKDGSVDFYLGWQFYKQGFGDLSGEFWLGNDNLHRLTTVDDMKMRVDMEDFDGDVRYAEYATFRVADESDKYRLTIGGYSGTAGDSMISSTNNRQFTTRDSDNDENSSGNCAFNFKGAWWYANCHFAHMNGLYLGGPTQEYATGVIWFTFRQNNYSLKRTEMKVRPVNHFA